MKILNTFEHTESGAAFFFVIAGILLIAQGIKWICFDKARVGGIVVLFFAAVQLFFATALFNAPPTIRYEATFDEKYPVSQLIEEYDIIEQRGDILIVEEKTK